MSVMSAIGAVTPTAPTQSRPAVTREDAAAAPLLHVEQVSKRLGGEKNVVRVLQPVSLTAAHGEVVAIVGPSGCGKSTLLRIIHGLTPADSGRVVFNGETVTGPHPDMGMVFQRNNLMPWRTVAENVLLPRIVGQGRSTGADREEVQRLLHLVGLAGFEDAYPQQLSGGMAQRAVLARTLLQRPRLLLLDEPFGSLDALTRERMNVELLRLQALAAQTVVLVTHSIAEAVFLADRVVVFSPRPGRVVAEVAVDLPKPRTLEIMGTPQFAQLTQAVRRQIDSP